jgi:hypothetical protein
MANAGCWSRSSSNVTAGFDPPRLVYLVLVRSYTFVVLRSGNLLAVLESSVVYQVDRDAGCPPGVTSDWSEGTRRLGPLPNRSPCMVAVKPKKRSWIQ